MKMANDRELDTQDRTSATKENVGGAIGGAAGVAAGAAIGSLAGPIGTIVGAVAGAVGGWWSGRALTDGASAYTNTDDAYYRERFASNSPALADRDAAYQRAMPAYQLGHLASRNPDYDGRPFDAVESDLERGWRGGGDGLGDWSDVRDYARDAYDHGREQRLTLSEEQLRIGKREVEAGEVNVRKSVETERVSQQVPVTHEEVVVERRPVAADTPLSENPEIGEDVIRVPLMAEEPVVDKRAVATEEVIVRKEPVTENRTVEADLRKERVDYDEDALSPRADGGTGARDRAAKGKGKGIADRVADAVDDMKDRFDANPASKPGRDATDRPGR
jgi:uncharacterized protein (TIGR02271 family)